jgi:hypothetical protein
MRADWASCSIVTRSLSRETARKLHKIPERKLHLPWGAQARATPGRMTKGGGPNFSVVGIGGLNVDAGGSEAFETFEGRCKTPPKESEPCHVQLSSPPHPENLRRGHGKQMDI